jgi:crotonobetainyl-CoA:carnitine CoA-transferase CaiB-like acyl-CoA transferase
MPASDESLPLAGMRVLDLSRALSGPFCAAILGDFGADVIKVEATPNGDMIRKWGPFDRGESAYYLSGNRNKRGIGVSFRSEEGRGLLREMALKSDVLVENFKPGVLGEMGLDPESLRAEKSSLIVASLSGFGSSGPLGERPGFDQIAQGYSGFMSFTGTPESGPTRVGVAIGDLTAGMWLSIGVMAAWAKRISTGRGSLVETSLLASLFGLLSVQGQRYLSLGEVALPTGNVHPVISPYGVFRSKDGSLNICAATQEMWVKLCEAIGAPELSQNERFVDNARRMAHREELVEIIERHLARKTAKEWTEAFVAVGIPAGPINDISDAVNDEQVQHLGLVETVAHPALGPIRQISNPLQLDGRSGTWIRHAPPLLGQHTREVLREFGFETPRIEDWEDRGVVYQREPAGAEPTSSKSVGPA